MIVTRKALQNLSPALQRCLSREAGRLCLSRAQVARSKSDEGSSDQRPAVTTSIGSSFFRCCCCCLLPLVSTCSSHSRDTQSRAQLIRSHALLPPLGNLRECTCFCGAAAPSVCSTWAALLLSFCLRSLSTDRFFFFGKRREVDFSVTSYRNPS